MKKTSKTGLVRGLSVLIVLILALSLTLTSCADKTAQSKADEAKTAADEAQKSADDAKTAASEAKDKADKAEADAKNNADAIAKLPDEAAVAEAIKNILTEYVKGTTLDKDSIVTTEELKKFLTSDQTANAISTALTDYAKTETVLETLKDYLTKEELEKIKTEMNNATAAKLNDYITAAAADAKYMTKEAAQAAINDVLAKMATKDELKQTQKDLETAKADLVQKIADAKTELTNAMNTGLKDQKAALEQQKKDLEAEITAAKTELNTAIGDAKTALEGKIAAAEKRLDAVEKDLKTATDKIAAAEKKITNLETELAGVKDRLTKVEAFGDRITKLENLVTGTEGGLDKMIKDLAQELIDANNKTYNDATTVVIEKLKELDKAYDDIDKSLYSKEANEKLYNLYFEAYVKLLRSLNAEAAEKVLDDAKKDFEDKDKVPNLADEAYELLNKIDDPILIKALTECENKDADSKAAIEAARKALDTAKAAMGAEAVEKYKTADGEVNLEERVAAAEATYANLEAAKAAAGAVQDVINALPEKSVCEAYTDNADILALKTTLESVKADYEAWVNTYFAKDTDNVNIARLVDMTKYNDDYSVLQEKLNGELLNNLKTKMVDALAKAGYITKTEDGYTVNGNCLFSTLADLTAVKNEVETDATAAGLDLTKTTIAAEYQLLNAAVDYATKMTAKKDEAEKAGGLIKMINNLGEAKLLAYSNCTKVTAANDTFKTWSEGMDEANINAILLSNKAALEALVARAGVLEDAKTAADALNTEIANCGKEIKNFKDIVALQAKVAEWLKNNEIVADSTAEGYVAENYDLVKHADLQKLYDEVKAKIDEAVKKAEEVLDKIKDVNFTATGTQSVLRAAANGKMLHQYTNIVNAEKALAEWLKNSNLEELDTLLGDEAIMAVLTEDQKNTLNNLKAEIERLTGARKAFDETLAAAKAQYEKDKAEFYDAFNALTAYQLKNGMLVRKAYSAALAWFNTYVDGTLGLADLEAQGVDTGFTSVEYVKIMDAMTAYEKTVADAKADADAVKALYDAIGTPDVYSYAKIKAALDAYTDWCKKYDVTEADYDNGTFETELAGMKDLKAKIDAANAAYEEVVKNAKADAESVKAAITATKYEDINIYSYKTVNELRAAYDAWANKYLKNNSFEGINDADLAKMAEVYSKLTTIEKLFNDLKDEKKAETEVVKGLLENLNKVIALKDKAEVEAARKAYNEWLKNIDASKTFTDAGYAYYEISDELVKYLTDAESRLENLNKAKSEAEKAVNSLEQLPVPGSGMDKNTILNYKAAIDAAKKAVEEFHKLGDDRIGDEYLQAITKAEFFYNRYDIAEQVQREYNLTCLTYEGDPNYAALKVEFDKVLNKYLSQIYDDTLLDRYYADNTVLDTILSSMKADLEAVVKA